MLCPSPTIFFSEFHFTKSRLSESPILEINLDRVRAMYLQRCTMTLINFFRDHFIDIIRQNILFCKNENEIKNGNGNENNIKNENEDKNENENEKINVNNNENIDESELENIMVVKEVEKEVEPRVEINSRNNENKKEKEEEEINVTKEIEKIEKLIISHFGVFRLCIRLSRIEIQVPTNSQGTDSICFLIPLGRIYKFCPQIANYDFLDKKGRERGREGGRESEGEIERNESKNGNENEDENLGKKEFLSRKDSQQENNNMSSNNMKKNKINCIHSDTPGLSYLRGPFLSSEKRISEHENILKSVKGLVNFRYGNTENKNLSKTENFLDVYNEKNLRNDKIKFVEKFKNKKIVWNLPQNLKISDEKMKRNILVSRQRTFSIESTDKSNRVSPMNSPKILSSLFKNSDYPLFSTSSSTSFSFPSPSPFCLKIELPNVTISSWCNENVIAENLRINGAVLIEKGIINAYIICI